MKVTRRFALAGVLALIITAAITASFRLPPPDSLPRCLDSVLIAFQTAQSPQEAASIWNQLGKAQANLIRGLYADFGFIAAYTFLFFVLAAITRRRYVRYARIAASLMMVSAIVTALADIAENLLTLGNIGILQHRLPTAGRVALMRDFSLLKWAVCGVTLMLLWWAFVPSRRGSALYRLVTLTIAFFSVLSGSMGILGFLDNSKIELVIPLLLPGLLLQFPLFWHYWDDLIPPTEPIANSANEA